MAEDNPIYDNINEFQQPQQASPGSTEKQSSSCPTEKHVYDGPDCGQDPKCDDPETVADEEYAEISVPTGQVNVVMRRTVIGQHDGRSADEVCPSNSSILQEFTASTAPSAATTATASTADTAPIKTGSFGTVKGKTPDKRLCTVLVVIMVICIAAIAVQSYMVFSLKKETEHLRTNNTRIAALERNVNNNLQTAVGKLINLSREQHANATSLGKIVDLHTNKLHGTADRIDSLERFVAMQTNRLKVTKNAADYLKGIVESNADTLKRITTETVARFVRPNIGRNANGRPYWRGNIEARHRNTWGTICSTGFSEGSARVLCRMVGFATGVYEENSYRQTVSRLLHAKTALLSNVVCNGTEGNIDQCMHSGWGARECSYNENIVGIRCSDEESIIRFPTSTIHEGTVEILYKNQWGTICGHQFTRKNAHVLCRSAGFTSGNSLRRQDVRRRVPKMWLSDVRCLGKETWIGECSHDEWGVYTCATEGVAVRCYKK